MMKVNITSLLFEVGIMAEKEVFKCEFCGKTFASEEELIKHEIERHPEQARKKGLIK
jgi:hypothetical protein